MANGNSTFEAIFKRPYAAEDTDEYLLELTNKYPYFVPAQFYSLLRSAPAGAGYTQQAARVATLFNNAYWLQFQLQEVLAGEMAENEEQPPASTNLTDGERDEKAQTAAYTLENNAALTRDQSANPKADDVASTGGVKEEPAEEEVQAYLHTQNSPSTAGHPDPEVVEKWEGMLREPETEPLVNDTSPEELAAPEREPLKFRFEPLANTPVATELSLEPLHASDYFASQGIRISSEIKADDKLGKQLKSFTEWLKTMKKVHSDQLPPLSNQADLSIQKLAERSNAEENVATEAMADVLLKQGKAEKAIEVYEKLSLLNPSKRTYFAAKIAQIKQP